jgi:8-oxo-dGTP pyrophosphatase MutT (NUDIX family)
MTYREGRFWQPDVTVATIVEHDGQYLMVEEMASGRCVINQPAGHLEPDESLCDAALRETREETGWDVRLTGFVGAYQWKATETGRHYLRFAFLAEPVALDESRTLDKGIVRATWMSPEQLQAEMARHRSPLVQKVIDDARAGRVLPLDMLVFVP